MTEPFANNVLPMEATVLAAAKALERARPKIVVIVDGQNRVHGTITDGDVRRGLLHGVGLEEPVTRIMHTEPMLATVGETTRNIRTRMREKGLLQVPIVDAEGRLVSIRTLDEIENEERHDNLVILLAGGLGTRLRPLTEQQPKPMLDVGGRPLLESIIERFKRCGFHRFRVSVNYRAEVIKEYFGDGTDWGVEIHYIEEDKPLGTAGPLGMLDEVPELPVIVMNGDVLTTIDFDNMLEFHDQRQAAVTVGARAFEFQVPFGTLDLEEGRITNITEKPIKSFFVNAGMYVLSPSVVQNVPRNKRMDMPDLLKTCIRAKQNVIAFPIHEYWLDIGRHADFEQAQIDILELT